MQNIVRKLLAVTTAAAATLLLEPTAVRSSAATCYSAQFRAGDADPSSTADAVRAYISTPSSANVSGWQGNTAGIASAADIYLYNNGGGFVQLGWYVGKLNSSTPYVTQPTLWTGESTGSGGEVLTTYGTIGWSVNRVYAIYIDSNGYADFFYRTNQFTSSLYTHNLVVRPAFNAEVNYQNTTMWGDAVYSGTPAKSLQWSSSSSTAFSYFNDNYFDQQTYGFYSGPDQGASTNFASGGRVLTYLTPRRAVRSSYDPNEHNSSLLSDASQAAEAIVLTGAHGRQAVGTTQNLPNLTLFSSIRADEATIWQLCALVQL